MQALHFEDDTRYTVQMDEQVWLHRSIGGHELRLQIAVGVSPFVEAGKLLALEVELFGFAAPPIDRARLGRTTLNLAYTQAVAVHRETLAFPLTTLQVHAIEAGRAAGDVRFEVEVTATLPQSAGFPGIAKSTSYVMIARSRWEEQLAQIAPSAAFEMRGRRVWLWPIAGDGKRLADPS